MQKIKIIRQFYREKQVESSLFLVDGSRVDFDCCILEPPWLDNQPFISCIPRGIYTGQKRTTKSRGEHLHILNVPGRTWILMHSGVYYTHTQGCQLPGEYFTDFNSDGLKDVAKSSAALTKLLSLIEDEYIQIEIL